MSEAHLPGAALTHGAGTHQGFDFFNGFSGRPLTRDEPAVAVADGEIIRIDHAYQDLGDEELVYYAKTSATAGFVGHNALDQLRGRQVWILHPTGHISRYAHLSEVNPKLQPGTKVLQGQPLGLIGNSGVPPTEDQPVPASHLHFELWSPDRPRHLCQDTSPLECHRQMRALFGAKALPRYAREVLEQVDGGEPAPDPYPPEEFPATGFSLEPPVFLTPATPFSAPATWEGDNFRPEDFFAQLAGRPIGVIDAGNGVLLYGALPMGYTETEAELMVGAADVYGQSLVGVQKLEVRPRETDTDPLEVPEEVMAAYYAGDRESEARALVEVGLHSLETTMPRWTAPFHAPLEGKVTRRFDQEIFHGLLRSAHPLPGVIIEAEPDAPVSAANAGSVVLTTEFPVRGHTVAVDHGAGVVSVYAHLAEISVVEGDSVERGETLGRAGDSGAAAETQVRWEIHVAGTPTDPLDWHQKVLPDRQPAN